MGMFYKFKFYLIDNSLIQIDEPLLMESIVIYDRQLSFCQSSIECFCIGEITFGNIIAIFALKIMIDKRKFSFSSKLVQKVNLQAMKFSSSVPVVGIKLNCNFKRISGNN